MTGGFDTARLRRGAYLLAVGAGITVLGIAIGWEFSTGARLSLAGPLLLVAGVGYVGAAAVPLFVQRIGGPDAEWEDLSLVWQLLVSAAVAIGLFVVYLLVWAALP
jgi:hypothetical protein